MELKLSFAKLSYCGNIFSYLAQREVLKTVSITSIIKKQQQLPKKTNPETGTGD